MKIVFLAVLALVGLLPAAASATTFGPSPYLCFDSATTTATGSCGGADSPFKSLTFNYFHLEDFNDVALTTPGVTETNGAIIASSGFGTTAVDSVDEDDGAIDSLGNIGDSMWNGGRSFSSSTPESSATCQIMSAWSGPMVMAPTPPCQPSTFRAR